MERAADALVAEVSGMTISFWHHLHDEHDHEHPFCVGQVTVQKDSDETAWVEPCNRLAMTDEVIGLVADLLRPMGVKWIRGWGDGGRQGRVITANGPINCEPWSEIYDAGA